MRSDTVIAIRRVDRRPATGGGGRDPTASAPRLTPQPLPGPVFIELVSKSAHLLARIAEIAQGTTEGAVGDEHARLEDELSSMLLERRARRSEHQLHDVKVLEAGERAASKRICSKALVGGDIAGLGEAIQHVAYVVPRHAQAGLAVADLLDGLAELMPAYDDPPRKVCTVCATHGDGVRVHRDALCMAPSRGSACAALSGRKVEVAVEAK